MYEVQCTHPKGTKWQLTNQVRCDKAYHGELEGNGGYDAGHDEDDAPDYRVAELDLGEVGEAGLDALRHVADVHQEKEARDEEGGPEGEAEEAVPGEDVDDAADEGEDDLPRLRHPRGRLDKVGVPGQTHDGAVSQLKHHMNG